MAQRGAAAAQVTQVNRDSRPTPSPCSPAAALQCSAPTPVLGQRVGPPAQKRGTLLTETSDK